jgi:peptidoglycan/LPS O-acetylase OafA/YrhL
VIGEATFSQEVALAKLKSTMSTSATPSLSTSSSRIPELDGLRGIAIILVILLHYFYQTTPELKHPATLVDHLYVWFRMGAALGWTGVDLFFVLSGFLIGGILLDVRDSPFYYKTFYVRRFYRIVPIYYLWLLGYIFLLLTIRDGLSAYSPEPFNPSLKRGVLWLFAFVQSVKFGNYLSLGWVWLVPTWSLAVEEQFYLVAPLLIRRLSRQALALVLGATLLMAPLLRLWVRSHFPIIGANWDLAYILMPCRADTLAIGVLAALFWRTPSLRAWLSNRAWLLYALTSASFAGMVFLGRSPNLSSFSMQSVGYTWIALFYGLVLILVLEKPQGLLAWLMRAKWLGEIGRLSYCIYLIHFATWWMFHLCVFLVESRPPQWHYTVASFASLIVVYAVARMSWRDIEYPLLRRGSAYQY